MPVSQYPRHPPTPTPTPTPMPRHFEMDQVQERRWARICIFPRNTYARLRYIPLRTRDPGQTQEALTQATWSCRTSFMKTHVVRAKYRWKASWDYYEIKFAIPIIPGFGRSNAALLRLQHCPEFVGEVAVVRRTGPRLRDVADMRIDDRRKVEVAITSILWTVMGMDGRYRGSILVQYMMSLEALDALQ